MSLLDRHEATYVTDVDLVHYGLRFRKVDLFLLGLQPSTKDKLALNRRNRVVEEHGQVLLLKLFFKEGIVALVVACFALAKV